MTQGILCRDLETGAVTFDSRQEVTMFHIGEQQVAGASVGAGRDFSYSGFIGKKIVATMTSPYQNGSVDGWAVLSCRVSYPGGVPTVRVFVDNALSSLPVCDGYLLVYATGADQ